MPLLLSLSREGRIDISSSPAQKWAKKDFLMTAEVRVWPNTLLESERTFLAFLTRGFMVQSLKTKRARASSRVLRFCAMIDRCK